MKTIKLITYIEFIVAIMLMSCTSGGNMQNDSSNETKLSTVTTLPKEVIIGKQVWMTVNLSVDKFRNGEVIPEAKTAGEWKAYRDAGEAAWCYYDNDKINGEKYGKLYNWYAVNDPRGLAPKGWHIPSDEEWTLLTDYLGGEEKAGAKLKSKNGWFDDGNGTNSSGFSGLPAGNRDDNGEFNAISEYSWWWSSTEYSNNSNKAWERMIDYNDGYVVRFDFYKGLGLSVRCLRD